MGETGGAARLPLLVVQTETEIANPVSVSGEITKIQKNPKLKSPLYKGGSWLDYL